MLSPLAASLATAAAMSCSGARRWRLACQLQWSARKMLALQPCRASRRLSLQRCDPGGNKWRAKARDLLFLANCTQHKTCFLTAASVRARRLNEALTRLKRRKNAQRSQEIANKRPATRDALLGRLLLDTAAARALRCLCAAAALAPFANPSGRVARREDAPMLYKAIGESTRFAVSGAVAATLLVRRDAETLTWVAGAILAAVCNKILKRIIKEDRPEAGDDGGMPSSPAACSVCHLGVGAALRFP